MVRKSVTRKGWSEKRADPRRTEVKTCPKDFADIKAGQRMVLPMPRDIEAVVRKLKPGSSLDMGGLRSALAQTYKADVACPVVTGIQLRTLAEAVGEQLDIGVSPAAVAPVWRAMPPDAPIWRKLENGRAKLMAQRLAEGLDG
jgi:hypothetical protein